MFFLLFFLFYCLKSYLHKSGSRSNLFREYRRRTLPYSLYIIQNFGISLEIFLAILLPIINLTSIIIRNASFFKYSRIKIWLNLFLTLSIDLDKKRIVDAAVVFVIMLCRSAVAQMVQLSTLEDFSSLQFF